MRNLVLTRIAVRNVFTKQHLFCVNAVVIDDIIHRIKEKNATWRNNRKQYLWNKVKTFSPFHPLDELRKLVRFRFKVDSTFTNCNNQYEWHDIHILRFFYWNISFFLFRCVVFSFVRVLKANENFWSVSAVFFDDNLCSNFSTTAFKFAYHDRLARTKEKYIAAKLNFDQCSHRKKRNTSVLLK